MTVALDKSSQEVFPRPSHPRTSWLMTGGFPVYTLLILVGHIVGFPLGYSYLHTVCPNVCALTPGNVSALERLGLSIQMYANLYMAIQIIYILACVRNRAADRHQKAWTMGTAGSQRFSPLVLRL